MGIHLQLHLRLLSLFLIPFGGGIPAGVIFAKNNDVSWPVTALLYLLSDIILAFVYEQLMLWVIRSARRSPKMTEVGLRYRDSLVKMGFTNLISPSPLALIILSVGVDPMTSRTVGHFAGRRFISGWAFAIAGDMVFFGALMASTLWLNNILGDGTMAALIVVAAMFIVPAIIKHVRGVRDPRVPKL